MAFIRSTFYFILLFFGSCSETPNVEKVPIAKRVVPSQSLLSQKTNEKKKLSEYEFFKSPIAELIPNVNVYSYDVNTPLFSDYASKKRFVFLPKDSQMEFSQIENTLLFETGSILIKNFYYPISKNEERIIETRLLIKEKEGWKPLNYIWNTEQTYASLNYIGADIEVEWMNSHEEIQKVNYSVPNQNQCKNCHISGSEITPIGLTVSQLNRKNSLLSANKNQLAFFHEANLIKNLPEKSNWSKLPVWNNQLTGTVEERAKAYLDANCAYCHSPKGSAKNSGLYLSYSETNSRYRGVYKPPIAAGKGSGDLIYDIIPGDPEHSILLYRMKSKDPSIQMPELGRSIVHEEGVSLIEEYIKNLKIN